MFSGFERPNSCHSEPQCAADTISLGSFQSTRIFVDAKRLFNITMILLSLPPGRAYCLGIVRQYFINIIGDHPFRETVGYSNPKRSDLECAGELDDLEELAFDRISLAPLQFTYRRIAQCRSTVIDLAVAFERAAEEFVRPGQVHVQPLGEVPRGHQSDSKCKRR